MRGSITYQVMQLFEQSGINAIGRSRHDAKDVARASGAKTSAEIGAQVGIHSYNTADAYRSVWRDLLEFVRDEFRVKDAERLEVQHVQAFLESKIEAGVAYATFAQYAAACTKLEQALNRYAGKNNTGRSYDITSGLADVRREAAAELRRFDQNRAYPAPDALIRELDNGIYQLAARIQLEGGARISEIALIKPGQLRGGTVEPVTGQRMGAYHVRSKGGHQRNIYLPPDTYHALAMHLSDNDALVIDKDAYRLSLRDAAAASQQPYSGSHGLRHNAAQTYLRIVQDGGATYEQAMLATSYFLGHSRASIILSYVRS